MYIFCIISIFYDFKDVSRVGAYKPLPPPPAGMPQPVWRVLGGVLFFPRYASDPDVRVTFTLVYAS